MTIFPWRHLHPLVAAAITSVLVTGLTAVARLTATLPPLPAPDQRSLPLGGSRIAAGPIVPGLQTPPPVSDEADAGPTSSADVDTRPAAADADAAPASSDMPLAVPAVFIHVHNQAVQQQVRMLGPALAERGLRLAGIKIVGRGPERSDLRYFRDDERGEAVQVQKALLALGLPVNRLKKIGGFEPVATPRQYEVWLAADYRPER